MEFFRVNVVAVENQ